MIVLNTKVHKHTHGAGSEKNAKVLQKKLTFSEKWDQACESIADLEKYSIGHNTYFYD